MTTSLQMAHPLRVRHVNFCTRSTTWHAVARRWQSAYPEPSCSFNMVTLGSLGSSTAQLLPEHHRRP